MIESRLCEARLWGGEFLFLDRISDLRTVVTNILWGILHTETGSPCGAYLSLR